MGWDGMDSWKEERVQAKTHLEAPDQQVGADQEEKCEHEPVVRKLVVGPLEEGVAVCVCVRQIANWIRVREDRIKRKAGGMK